MPCTIWPCDRAGRRFRKAALAASRPLLESFWSFLFPPHPPLYTLFYLQSHVGRCSSLYIFVFIYCCYTQKCYLNTQGRGGIGAAEGIVVTRACFHFFILF